MGVWLNNNIDDIWWGYDEFDTKEDAIENGVQQYIDAMNGYSSDLFYDDDPDSPLCSVFCVGEQEKFVPYVDADVLIEDIQMRALDYGGEYAEEYLEDVTKEDKEELQRELQNVFDSWANRHRYNPGFFTIINIEEIDAKDYL